MEKYASSIVRSCVVCFCCVVWQLKATGVHISPIWYDQKAKNWEILIGRNAGTALWTDFDKTGLEDYRLLAQSCLKKLTCGRYSEKNSLVAGAVDIVENDQHFLFVPVFEHLDYKTMRKAKNVKKREFAWVPMTIMLGFGPVSDNRKRKPRFITVEPNFRAMLRVFWPDVVKKLAASAGVKDSVVV